MIQTDYVCKEREKLIFKKTFYCAMKLNLIQCDVETRSNPDRVRFATVDQLNYIHTFNTCSSLCFASVCVIFHLCNVRVSNRIVQLSVSNAETHFNYRENVEIVSFISHEMFVRLWIHLWKCFSVARQPVVINHLMQTLDACVSVCSRSMNGV